METRRTLSWRQEITTMDSIPDSMVQLRTDTDPTSAEFNFKSNMLAPLYRLPNEIITRILLVLQIEDLNYDMCFTAPYLSCISIDWVRAMLICRRFRDVAVSSAILWSFIDVENLNSEWHKLCATRAAKSPLDVFAILRPAPDVLSMDGSQRSLGMDARTRLAFELIPRAHRVQLVIPDIEGLGEIDVDYDDVMDQVSDILSAGYLNVEQPALRSLEIFDLSTNWLVLSKTFLGETPTTLTYLLLDGCHIQLDVPQMPALRTLILNHLRLDTHCTSLRTVLQNTPAITFLRIDHPLTNPWPEVPKSLSDAIHTIMQMPPTHLPKLHTLHLIGPYLELGRVTHVVPDPSHHFVLEIKNTHYDIDNLAPQPAVRRVLEDFSRELFSRLARFLSSAPAPAPAGSPSASSLTRTRNVNLSHHSVVQAPTRRNQYQISEAMLISCTFAHTERLGALTHL